MEEDISVLDFGDGVLGENQEWRSLMSDADVAARRQAREERRVLAPRRD